MPNRAPHPCAARGCPALVRSGERYCAIHAALFAQQQDAQRGTSAQRGYDANWQRLRKMILNDKPLCADPFKLHQGRPVVATDVDHIKPLRDGGTNDAENLQALCHECHSKKTATSDGGWGRHGN